MLCLPHLRRLTVLSTCLLVFLGKPQRTEAVPAESTPAIQEFHLSIHWYGVGLQLDRHEASQMLTDVLAGLQLRHQELHDTVPCYQPASNKIECVVNIGGCSQICRDTPTSDHCDCRPGFQLTNNSTCDDINECEIPGSCSQLCTNTEGGFECSCKPGYKLVGHQHCKAVEGHVDLLLASNHGLHKLNLDTQEYTSVVQDLPLVLGMDYTYSAGLVVWSDERKSTIRSTSLSKDMPFNEVITSNLRTPIGIAVDWIYEHIYWTDTDKEIIEVSNLQGTMRRTLIDNDLDYPRPIAVDPNDGWMFWSDWGQPAKIERAGMDGSHRSAIITTDIQWPNGLSLDYVDKRIFWVDVQLKVLCSANYDGSGRRVVLSDSQFISHPYAVDVFEDSIYWNNYDSIYSVNKHIGKNVSIVKAGISSPVELAVYHPLKQPKGENYCKSMNGSCSDFCLPAPRILPTSPNIRCSCPDGKVLASDGLNCVDGDGHILLVAYSSSIHKLNLRTNEYSPVATNLHRAQGVDYIYSMGLVFWSEMGKPRINSTSLSEGLSVNNVITTDIPGPESIAVDWIYEHIYWTGYAKRTIEVSNLQGTSRKTLFDTDLENPSAVAVDPIDGWMFWADWGIATKIQRAGMDGSHRSAIITTDIQSPNGLALDYVDKRIFWMDSKLSVLCSANYDGSARIQVALDVRRTISLPVGFDVFEDYVYWTDMDKYVIKCVNKHTGDHVRSVKVAFILDLAVYHPLKQPRGENNCKSVNVSCSHFCFPAPRIFPTSSKVSCACPDGKVLANDGLNCVDGGH